MNTTWVLRWLAIWRWYVALIWLNYGTSKIEPKWAGGEFLSAVKYSASGVHGFEHDFLINVVIPHQQVFAYLITYGETLVGISLILGLLTKAGAVGGMFLALNYWLGTGNFQFRFGIESLELLLFASCLMLLVLPTSAVFSLDALLRQRFSKPRAGVQVTS